MDIREAQKEVKKFLEEIGYTKIEKEPIEAFTHLVEEVGEAARAILHETTKRGKLTSGTQPEELEDELADVFWQVLKVAIYLEIDLEEAFLKKFDKNKKKPKLKKL